MSKNKSLSMKMVATKNEVVQCSTPENLADSPSRDSDSEAASPVPFLCTQDGAEGETDVVWNFYTPKAEHAKTRSKNSTPLSRKSKKVIRPKIVEKQIPKRRALRVPHKKTQLFQELIELNQKLPELLAKKSQLAVIEKDPSGSEDDIFNQSPEYSPKSGFKNTSRCLRKNVLSSKFKPEIETALESDDSMNECLLKASQIVEENLINCHPSTPKRICHESHYNSVKKNMDFKMDQDSMDSILNSIKLESPALSKVKKVDSPRFCNDSFDSFVGNLNDSALEQLTQMPIKNDMTTRKSRSKMKECSDWTLKELIVHDGSPTLFGRHSSMPESPSVIDSNKPSTSGMVFGRYNSMPYNQHTDNAAPGDSPIRCTPEEIKRKHQQAREKLLAKRQLPFTSSQTSTQSLPEKTAHKTTKFQPRLPSSVKDSNPPRNSQQSNSDIKSIIEKKRQEALMKLRRRQAK